ncbi:MAG: hypothetical protein LKG18_04285 [Saccharofermentans sp.]|jgi:hypothetical protein|nr:hypothetical protein [Saccharofermentans sp.]
MKIVENNGKYPDISLAIRITLGTEEKNFYEVSDKDVLNNLYMHIQGMCVKEQENINYFK